VIGRLILGNALREFRPHFQAVFFAKPEGEILRRLAFLLRARQRVRLYACIAGVDAEKARQRGVNVVPVTRRAAKAVLQPAFAGERWGDRQNRP
jgi:hypothetical protein